MVIDGEAVPTFDPMGKDAALFHHTAEADPEALSSQYVADVVSATWPVLLDFDGPVTHLFLDGRNKRLAGHALAMHKVCRCIYHVVMGSLVQIRNVPDEQRRVLKARAAARGESLNAYLLDVLSREVARPSVTEVLDRAARRTERAKASALDAVDAARSHRDAEIPRRSRT